MSPEEREALRQQLITHEGILLRLYDDATGRPIKVGDTLKGNATIGVGLNLMAGITMPEALYLLDTRINATIGGVSQAIPWFPRLSAMRQRVLIDIAYNAGTHGLLGFRKMLAAAEAGDYATAGDEILNSTIAPARAARLARMMKEERV